MKIIILVLFIGALYLNCNQTPYGKSIIIRNKESNSALRELVHKKLIKGKVFHNDLDETKSDSIVELYFDKPFYQGYPIDSIYFLFFDGDVLKILASSEFEKGLIYIEGNSEGFHKRFFSFGGYVQKVSNINITEFQNSFNLNFDYVVWGSTMPKPISQKVKIISKYHKVDFEIYFVDKNKKELKASID